MHSPFFAIDRSSRQIVYNRYLSWKNAELLICLTLTGFFGCKVILEIFNALRVPFSDHFYTQLWLIMDIVNALSNISFTIAVLCMQPKTAYTLQY